MTSLSRTLNITKQYQKIILIESSASYDSQLETNDNENHLSYIEEENATSAFPPSASPIPEVLPIPSNESDNDEDIDYSDADPNFSIRSHQSSSRSSVVKMKDQGKVKLKWEKEKKKGKKIKANLLLQKNYNNLVDRNVESAAAKK
ncbi:hypothetical protein HHI36_003431 [Cryptolaemus montrouzieri]|uniref:Uncharacterized protein n=1 Tax=Cryptolaemus montrouzieri TaxID=559131 RepID=A0ABD2PDE8_9CUCU